LRTRAAFGVDFVRFVAVVVALRLFAVAVFALAVVLFDPLGLVLFTGAALVGVVFLVAADVPPISACGFVLFTGCHVCGDRIAVCLRNSRAASSGVRRPRCVYIPGFTLFCLLIYGT
jgi:hypothetical protein